MKKKNLIAKNLRSPKYRSRIVKAKKGKGSFKRRKKYINLTLLQFFELFLKTFQYLFQDFPLKINC